MPDPFRTIVHLDLDAFYCACHELVDPALRGKPVIVGADPEDGRGRGVVATANYEARKYGVGSAMPISEAYRRCPQAVYLRPDRVLYHAHSERVMGILRSETDLVQQVSVDEAFLDVSHLGWDSAHARRLRDRVTADTGLPCSTGQATSKLVAKIACGIGKPGGAVLVPPGAEAGFLAPLSVGQMIGVGPKTAQRLLDLGLSTLGDVANCEPASLAGAVGPRIAMALIQHAKGRDDSPVTPEREAKSISEETTFARDVADRGMLWQTLQELAEEVARRLGQAGVVGRTITLKLRYSAGFETHTRAITVGAPFGDEDGETIAKVVGVLMRGLWERGRPVRLLGVRASNLSPVPDSIQLPLPPPLGRE